MADEPEVSFAPRHDWALYEERCRPARLAWLRSLTPAQGAALFAEMHALVASLEVPAEEAEAMRLRHRQEKIALRRKMVAAFQALDRLRSERSNHDHSR